jgi:SAM-dependent methyltransferase
MSAATAQVWQDQAVIDRFLTGVRGGIPLAGEQIQLLLRLTGSAVPDLGRFLDLGCGDGLLGRSLLSRWPGARGVFLDFASPMLEACRQALGSESAHHQLLSSDYGVSDWTAEVEVHAPFDVVVSGYSIHHQEDARKRELYGEIFSLLRPGGLFLNLEHVASASAWAEEVFDAHFVDALVDFHARAGTGKSRAELESEYYRRPDKAANRLAPVEIQCTWLRELGYERVDCFFKVFELALFGGVRPECGDRRMKNEECGMQNGEEGDSQLVAEG